MAKPSNAVEFRKSGRGCCDMADARVPACTRHQPEASGTGANDNAGLYPHTYIAVGPFFLDGLFAGAVRAVISGKPTCRFPPVFK